MTNEITHVIKAAENIFFYGGSRGDFWMGREHLKTAIQIYDFR